MRLNVFGDSAHPPVNVTGRYTHAYGNGLGGAAHGDVLRGTAHAPGNASGRAVQSPGITLGGAVHAPGTAFGGAAPMPGTTLGGAAHGGDATCGKVAHASTDEASPAMSRIFKSPSFPVQVSSATYCCCIHCCLHLHVAATRPCRASCTNAFYQHCL